MVGSRHDLSGGESSRDSREGRPEADYVQAMFGMTTGVRMRLAEYLANRSIMGIRVADSGEGGVDGGELVDFREQLHAAEPPRQRHSASSVPAPPDFLLTSHARYHPPSPIASVRSTEPSLAAHRITTSLLWPPTFGLRRSACTGRCQEPNSQRLAEPWMRRMKRPFWTSHYPITGT